MIRNAHALRMLPLRASKEDKQEVTASLVAAKEASEETAVVAVLSQMARQRKALNAFLGWKDVFAWLGFGKILVNHCDSPLGGDTSSLESLEL